MFKMYKQTHAEKNVGQMLKLFKSQVMQCLCHGCEVWGPDVLMDMCHAKSRNALSAFRMKFFRHLLGARASTGHLLMLRELGEYPLHAMIAAKAVALWNKVMEMPRDSLVRIAMLQDRSLFECKGTRDCWFGRMHEYLSTIGCARMVSVDGSPAMFFDRDRIVQVQRARCHDQFRRLRVSGTEDSIGTKMAKYHHTFAQSLPASSVDSWGVHPYLCACLPYDAVTKLARFRLGCHFLQIEVGRWDKKKYVSRAERYCRRDGCKDQGMAVDNEFHAIFECGAFEAIRSAHSRLFASGRKDLKSLFSCSERSRDLVKFIKAINVC
jgi:hypothetical protein